MNKSADVATSMKFFAQYIGTEDAVLAWKDRYASLSDASAILAPRDKRKRSSARASGKVSSVAARVSSVSSRVSSNAISPSGRRRSSSRASPASPTSPASPGAGQAPRSFRSSEGERGADDAEAPEKSADEAASPSSEKRPKGSRKFSLLGRRRGTSKFMQTFVGIPEDCRALREVLPWTLNEPEKQGQMTFFAIDKLLATVGKGHLPSRYSLAGGALTHLKNAVRPMQKTRALHNLVQVCSAAMTATAPVYKWGSFTDGTKSKLVQVAGLPDHLKHVGHAIEALEESSAYQDDKLLSRGGMSGGEYSIVLFCAELIYCWLFECTHDPSASAKPTLWFWWVNARHKVIDAGTDDAVYRAALNDRDVALGIQVLDTALQELERPASYLLHLNDEKDDGLLNVDISRMLKQRYGLLGVRDWDLNSFGSFLARLESIVQYMDTWDRAKMLDGDIKLSMSQETQVHLLNFDEYRVAVSAENAARKPSVLDMFPKFLDCKFFFGKTGPVEAFGGTFSVGRIADRYIQAMCMIMAACHLQLSQRIAEIFDCTEQVTQRKTMDSFPEIECDPPPTAVNQQHNTLKQHAYLFGLIYTVGIPALFLFLVGWKVVRPGHQHKRDIKARFGYMYQKYSVRCWYWEVVLMFRKLLVQVWSMFTGDDEADQLLQAAGAFFFFLMLWWFHMSSAPYIEVDLNKIDAMALSCHVFVMFGGSMFLTGKLEVGLVLIYAFLVIVVTVYVMYILFFFVIKEVSETVPLLQCLVEFDFWQFYLVPLIYASAKYYILGARYKTDYIERSRMFFAYLRPRYEVSIRNDLVERLRVSGVMSHSGMIWAEAWLRDFDTSLREGELYVRWFEDYVTCVNRSAFGQIIQEDWSTRVLHRDNAQRWARVMAKALRLFTTHDGLLIGNRPQYASIEASGSAVVDSIVPTGVAHLEGLIVSAGSVDPLKVLVDRVGSRMYADVSGDRRDRVKRLADADDPSLQGIGTYHLVDVAHRPDREYSMHEKPQKWTTKIWDETTNTLEVLVPVTEEQMLKHLAGVAGYEELGEDGALALRTRGYKRQYRSLEDVGDWVLVRINSRHYINGRLERASAGQEVMGKEPKITVFFAQQDAKGGASPKIAASPALTGPLSMSKPKTVRLADLRLRKRVHIEQLRVYSAVYLEERGRLWPAVINQVDSYGRYRLQDATNVLAKKPVARERLSYRGLVEFEEDRPVGAIWHNDCEREDEDEALLLRRSDKSVVLNLEDELATKDQIEWFQTRLPTSSVFVGGYDDGRMACVGFADGTVDVWSLSSGEKIQTLMHSDPAFTEPVRHVYIAPLGFDVVTFSRTHAVVWQVPEDSENSPSRVYFDGQDVNRPVFDMQRDSRSDRGLAPRNSFIDLPHRVNRVGGKKGGELLPYEQFTIVATACTDKERLSSCRVIFSTPTHVHIYSFSLDGLFTKERSIGNEHFRGRILSATFVHEHPLIDLHTGESHPVQSRLLMSSRAATFVFEHDVNEEDFVFMRMGPTGELSINASYEEDHAKALVEQAGRLAEEIGGGEHWATKDLEKLTFATSERHSTPASIVLERATVTGNFVTVVMHERIVLRGEEFERHVSSTLRIDDAKFKRLTTKSVILPEWVSGEPLRSEWEDDVWADTGLDGAIAIFNEMELSRLIARLTDSSNAAEETDMSLLSGTEWFARSMNWVRRRKMEIVRVRHSRYSEAIVKIVRKWKQKVALQREKRIAEMQKERVQDLQRQVSHSAAWVERLAEREQQREAQMADIRRSVEAMSTRSRRVSRELASLDSMEEAQGGGGAASEQEERRVAFKRESERKGKGRRVAFSDESKPAGAAAATRPAFTLMGIGRALMGRRRVEEAEPSGPGFTTEERRAGAVIVAAARAYLRRRGSAQSRRGRRSRRRALKRGFASSSSD